MKIGISRPSPAMVIAVIALICGLTGTAFAALGKNSVGSRQLKAKSVTTRQDRQQRGQRRQGRQRLAQRRRHQRRRARHGAQGDQRRQRRQRRHGRRPLGRLPRRTVLIRGICFDAGPNPAVNGQGQAADACAAKGGWLPAPMELYSTRGVLNLGTGHRAHEEQFTNVVYANTNGVNYRTVTVDGTGRIVEHQTEGDPAQYICAYALVR